MCIVKDILDTKYKIGHSILRYPIYGKDGYVEGFRTVNKGFKSKGYNLLTHNCSDSTKEALEKATGIKHFYLQHLEILKILLKIN